jgi:HAD superfamily hydrolase (TIGR01484 family)
VKPLDALEPAEARLLRGVIFDLDDTILDHGALGEAAYGALFRLREAGLRLVGCTGRPAGWADVLVRQWPASAIVAENGSIAFVASSPDEGHTRRITVVDALAPAERRARRASLVALADEIVARFPETALADDNDARRTDVTLDIGEHRSASAAVIREMRAFARSRGVSTLVSSVHMHLTLETDDKATGTLRLLVDRFGEDATSARRMYAFVGDSANDAAAFAAFPTSFGVANVQSHLRGLTVPPRYVAPFPMGAGFAAIAARITELRSLPG